MYQLTSCEVKVDHEVGDAAEEQGLRQSPWNLCGSDSCGIRDHSIHPCRSLPAQTGWCEKCKPTPVMMSHAYHGNLRLASRPSLMDIPLSSLSATVLSRVMGPKHAVQKESDDRYLYMTARSMAKTGCTVELLEVPRNMADTKMAPITLSTSPWVVLQKSHILMSRGQSHCGTSFVGRIDTRATGARARHERSHHPKHGLPQGCHSPAG